MKLKTLLTDGGSIDITTTGGVDVTITKQLLTNLVSVPPKTAPPNDSELLMFANMIVEQKLNPYLKECWLVYMQGSYQPIVAAQSRMRKVMSMDDYEGWEWGYIIKDGTRVEQGGKAPLPDIVGLWGKVYRKGRKPYHHELMKCDYAKGNNLTMCQKAHKDQAHRYAYADAMGNLCTDNELPMMELETKRVESQVITEADLEEDAPPEPTESPVSDAEPELTDDTVQPEIEDEEPDWVTE